MKNLYGLSLIIAFFITMQLQGQVEEHFDYQYYEMPAIEETSCASYYKIYMKYRLFATTNEEENCNRVEEGWFPNDVFDDNPGNYYEAPASGINGIRMGYCREGCAGRFDGNQTFWLLYANAQGYAQWEGEEWTWRNIKVNREFSIYGSFGAINCVDWPDERADIGIIPITMQYYPASFASSPDGNGNPCPNSTVSFRFGSSGWACETFDEPVNYANWVRLAGGDTYELRFWDPNDNRLGVYCGEGEPEVEYGSPMGNTGPPAIEGDDPPDSGPPNGGPPDSGCEGVCDPPFDPPPPCDLTESFLCLSDIAIPNIWDASIPFDFTQYFDCESLSFYVLDRSTDSFKKVQYPEAHYFNTDGHDQWGRVEFKVINTDEDCTLSNDPEEFTIEVIDAGLYFIQDNGSGDIVRRKFVLEHYNRAPQSYEGFFDPSLPTLVYVHGRQLGAVSRHEAATLIWEGFTDDQTGGTFRPWIHWTNGNNFTGESWNVVVYNWTQYADVPQLCSSVGHIWEDTPGWRRESGEWEEEQPANFTAIGTRLANELKDYVSITQNQKLRLAGTSLGAHVVSRATGDIYFNASYGNVRNVFDRLVYLDPMMGPRVTAFYRDQVEDNWPIVTIYHNTPFREISTASNWVDRALGLFPNCDFANTTIQDLENLYARYPTFKVETAWADGYPLRFDKVHNQIVPYYLNSLKHPPPTVMLAEGSIDSAPCPEGSKIGEFPYRRTCFPFPPNNPGLAGYQLGLSASQSNANINNLLLTGLYQQVFGKETFTTVDDGYAYIDNRSFTYVDSDNIEEEIVYCDQVLISGMIEAILFPEPRYDGRLTIRRDLEYCEENTSLIRVPVEEVDTPYEVVQEPKPIVDELKKQDVRVYPNPTKDNITIEYEVNSNSQVQVSLWDITGQRLYFLEDQYINSGVYQKQIVTDHLIPGIYLIQFLIDGQVTTTKIIKQ